MKGAIIVNNPYHNADCCYSTNKELADRMDTTLFYDDPDLNEKIRNLKDLDYIVALMNEKEIFEIDSLSKLEVPVMIAAGDIPKRLRNNLFVKMTDYHKANGIIVENLCTIPVLKDYLTRGEDLDFLYYPWGIDENYIKDYGEPKIHDVALLGAFHNYQHKREIDFMLNDNRLGIDYMRFRPNRNKVTKATERSYDDYCRTLNGSKMAIGGSTQHKDYSYFKGIFMGLNFPKNMEIAGLNTVLVNTDWGDMESLGFKNEENFIQFKSARDCVRKILKYKEEPDEIERISKNGYELVHKRHTNKIHADNIIKEIEEIYL